METNGTSILEHLRVEDTEARFLLDGREVQIKGDAYTPCLQAMRMLYEEAWKEIEAHQSAAYGRPTVLSRIGALGKRLLQGFGSKRTFFRPAAAEPQSPLPGNPTGLVPSQLPGGIFQIARGQPTTGGSGLGSPMIDAIFADRMGVRVVWHRPYNGAADILRKEPDSLTALTFPLDSQIARRLQTCYAELAKLGYKPVSLDALGGKAGMNKDEAYREREESVSSAVRPRENQARSGAEEPLPANPTSVAGDASRPQGKEQPWEASSAAQKPLEGTTQEARIQPAAAKQPPGDVNASGPKAAPEYVIMRLHQASLDSPARGLVSPVDTPGDPEVLNAPELLLRALTAVSHAGIDEKDRLSFLRCIRAEGGLKIVDLGFGLVTANNREPERWEDAEAWWEHKGKALSETPRVPLSRRSSEVDPIAIPSRLFEPGNAPLRTGSEPTPN
jgi:hypothetical protein